MKLLKCNKCGKVSEPFENNNSPQEWKQIYIFISRGGTASRKNYDICSECREKLGIPEDYHDGEKHIQENLLDLLEEIANYVAHDVMTGN